MKKKIFPLLSILLIAAACKKENSNSNGSFTPQNSKQISFNVDGTSYVFSDTNVLADNLGSIIHVHHEDSLNNYFVFEFKKNIAVGNYEFSTDSQFQFMYAYGLDSAQFYKSINQSGTVHISSNDQVNHFVQGSFSCPVRKNVAPYDVKTVNSGTFSIRY